MSSPESKFISLNEACRVVVGEEGWYAPIRFLAEPDRYKDLIEDLHVSGSITTPNPETMGECSISYTLSGIHNRVVRLPARKRRTAQQNSRYLPTNIHSCVNAGLFDLDNLDPNGIAWYKPLKAMGGTNFDIVGKSKMSPHVAYELLFQRFTDFLAEIGDHDSFVSLINNGRTTYLHYRNTFHPYSQHFNLLLFENSYLDPWNKSRTSREHQVRGLAFQEDVPGFFTNPKFFSEPGKLSVEHKTLGGYLTDVGKEIRLAVTNFPHRINIPSFTEKEPSDTTTSFSEEAIWLGNIIVSALKNPDYTWELANMFELNRYFNKQSSLKYISQSMYQADKQFYRNPDRAIYPNSKLHQLPELAPLVDVFLTMPFFEYIEKASQSKSNHHVTHTTRFNHHR